MRKWAGSCGVTADVKPTSSSEEGRRKESLVDGLAAVSQSQGDDEQVFRKGQRLSDKEHREREELATPRSTNRPHPGPFRGVRSAGSVCGPCSWFDSGSLGLSLFGVSSVMQGWEEYPPHGGVVKRKRRKTYNRDRLVINTLPDARYYLYAVEEIFHQNFPGLPW